MLHRVTIRAADRGASEAFYGIVLPAVGLERALEQFAVVAADEGGVTSRLHVGFRAASHAEVDEFWRLGIEAGYRDDGAPGPRTQYAPDYYGAFLLDPDGNSAEAVYLDNDVGPGHIDHLWIRVRNLAASRRFYESLAEQSGFSYTWEHHDPPRVGFRADDGPSFSVVYDGRPTENAQVTLATSGEAHLLTDPDGNTVELVRKSQ